MTSSAHLTVSSYRNSSVSNVCVEVEGPLRTPCQLKEPFKGLRLRLGRLLGGTEEKVLIVNGWMAFIDG